MKHIHNIALLLCLAMVACKKESADFSYSPLEPRAGQTVVFSNSSSTGEDWSWQFGDGSTSSTKNPVKIYRQPGTYTIILQVDNKKSLTRTKEITIYDTIPNFSSSIDSTGVGIYEDITLKALVYNPYSKPLHYKWGIAGEDRKPVVTCESDTAATYSVYFCQHGEVRITLDVNLDGTSTHIEHSYTIKDRPSEGVLQENVDGAFRQRIYTTRHTEPARTTEAHDIALLAQAQDSMQTYNDSTFILKNLTMGGKIWDGFRIANQRIYLRSLTDGLYVYRLDGAYGVCIDPQPTLALMIDPIDNRIYWALEDSVMYMPLVDQNFNEFTTVPQKLSNLSGVQRLAKDNEKR